MISFRNPNSLSHKTDNPPKVDEKRMFIPIIPGTKNCIYPPSPANPGIGIFLNPIPRNARKNNGMAKDPTIRDFALHHRFISLIHNT
jgi:hypothetical protein